MEFFDLSYDFMVMFSRLLINVLATWIIIDRIGVISTSRSCLYLLPSSSSSSS